ncbi:MAG: DUF4421 domain-containing protein [Prevotella sp.]|nr:DUF4421 domain-containing protein [Prevotella sp.]
MWKRSLLLIFMMAGFVALRAEEPADTTVAAACSQPRKLSLLRRIIRGFDRLDLRYIEPQHYLYTVMLQATHTYDIYTLSGVGRNPQAITFAPDMKFKLGPYVGWKWFFAGYTFQLGNVNLSSIRQELDLSIYSSQIGIDLFYRRTGDDYKLRNARLKSGDRAVELDGVPFDGLKAGITGFNVYYIFNHGRFSYPAAFSQSTIQKVSCGSPMAGIGYTRNSLSLDHARLQSLIDDRLGEQTLPLDSALMFRSVAYSDVSLSGGYAYNWVFRKNWLFAVSGQAAVGYKKSKGDVDAERHQGFSFENVNIDMIGRFGLVYNCMRWYAGASVILHSYNYHKPRFSTNNTFGSMNVYVGYNFGLKKKYRERHETTY